MGQPPLPAWNEAIRAIREARGVTQDAWSAWLGVSRKTIQRWERGETAPDARAEAEILAYCRERGLLRSFDSGPLAGHTLTPDLLAELLARGRLRGGRGAPAPPRRPGLSAHRAPILAAEPTPAADVAAPAVAGSAVASPSSLGPTPAPARPVAPRLPLTRFVGRGEELTAIHALLTETRLLTLTGAGGVGKTRLAQHAVHELVEWYADGCYLTELAALGDGQLVAGSVAATLGVAPDERDPMAALAASIGDRRLLLLLDNCEHLRPACAALAETLLDTCPNLHLLATSREPLRVAGEMVLVIRPLSIPEMNAGVARTGAADAVRLFVERARAAHAGFMLTERNAAAVAEVCRRVDGLPLAVELAAAWTRALAPEEIANRLALGARILTGDRSTAPPRQQTMEAAIDWSYTLLAEPERRLLRALSVFAGGFTLDAAEQVFADGREDSETLDLLVRLVDQSLVAVEEGREGGGGVRYRLLEPIRAFAATRLTAAGEAITLRDQHARWCLDLAERGDRELRGSRQIEWGARLDREHDNLRAAIGWLEACGHAEMELRLVAALGYFWATRGYLDEGLRRVQAVMARTSELASAADARSLATYNGGIFAVRRGEYATARMLLADSLTAARALESPLAMARALNGLGIAARDTGDYTSAEQQWQEALGLFRRIGDQRGVSVTLNNLGIIAREHGDHARARACWQECLDIDRAAGDLQGEGNICFQLATLALIEDDDDRAEALLRESLAMRRQVGYQYGVGYALAALGALITRRGDRATGQAHLDESVAIMRRIGHRQGEAFALRHAAAAALERGEAIARELYTESLRLSLAASDRLGEIDALLGLGFAHLSGGAAAAALPHFGQALTLSLALGYVKGRAAAREGQGIVALLDGRTAQALDHLHEAADLFARLGSRRAVARCAEALAAAGTG